MVLLLKRDNRYINNQAALVIDFKKLSVNKRFSYRNSIDKLSTINLYVKI